MLYALHQHADGCATWFNRASAMNVSKDFEHNAPNAAGNDPDTLCRFLGKINYPAVCIRTAVVDPHHDRLVCRFVRDADTGSERQAAMGRGQIVHVECLTVRCLLPVKSGSIP